MSLSEAMTLLGVVRSDTEQDIKKKYRNLSKKLHPDNKTTGDNGLFIKINEAYNIVTKYQINDNHTITKKTKVYHEYNTNYSNHKRNIHQSKVYEKRRQEEESKKYNKSIFDLTNAKPLKYANNGIASIIQN